ncbi:MAG: ABC transporter permease [Lachnospiraceae bacterium]|nr:ABC transporter permease [Lachnospiraceae bacterium]
MNKTKHSSHIGVKTFNSVMPVLLAFVIGAVIIAVIGENPLETYRIMITKSLFDIKGLTRTLQVAAPLFLTAIATSLCFKANIFNMGIEGQLVFGGFMAGIVGHYVTGLGSVPHKLLCFGVSILCAVVFALIPTLLRAYLRVDEMVVTLVLNYAMARILEYLSSGIFKDRGAGYVATPPVQDSAKFFLMGTTKVSPFIFIAILVFILAAFIMIRTKLGYTITAMGKNPSFAEATGLQTRRTVVVLMMLSAVIAGIAGAGYMLSEKTFYTLDFSGSPGLGWDGMLIALLGRHSPAGIVAACLFYSALKTGVEKIGLYTSVPNEIVSIIQGLIVLFLAVQFMDERYGFMEKFRQKLAAGKEA